VPFQTPKTPSLFHIWPMTSRIESDRVRDKVVGANDWDIVADDATD
jgi:hypothetical protein